MLLPASGSDDGRLRLCIVTALIRGDRKNPSLQGPKLAEYQSGQLLRALVGARAWRRPTPLAAAEHQPLAVDNSTRWQ